MTTHHSLMAAGFLSLIVTTNPVWGAEKDSVESRGLNLPRVTVPAPQAPPPPTTHTLNVRVVGEGQGKVTLPPAAACPPACAVTYPQGVPVVLAAVPSPGSTFAGWAGDCRGTAPCALRMDQPHLVEAKFNKLQTSAHAEPSTPSFPDVAKTPSPGGPIPIPYPNFGGRPLAPELTAIGTMLGDGKPADTILDAWKRYVAGQTQAGRTFELPLTLQGIKAHADTIVKARTEAERARIQSLTGSMGDQQQQTQVALQNLLQRQQQALQVISNMLKAMHESATSIIQNMK